MQAAEEVAIGMSRNVKSQHKLGVWLPSCEVSALREVDIIADPALTSSDNRPCQATLHILLGISKQGQKAWPSALKMLKNIAPVKFVRLAGNSLARAFHQSKAQPLTISRLTRQHCLCSLLRRSVYAAREHQVVLPLGALPNPSVPP